MSEIQKLPTMSELISGDINDFKQDVLVSLLNQSPSEKWVLKNNNIPYIPIERVEWLMTKIFRDWSVEVKTVQVIANSVVVSVRVHVKHPLTGAAMYQDGVGAMPMQTDKGASPTDFTAIKNNSVQLAAPAAETFAFKDACEKFGKLFGRDVTRKLQLSYEGVSERSGYTPISEWESIESDFETIREQLTESEIADIQERIAIGGKANLIGVKEFINSKILTK